jgi:16S rRNA (guanine527-N7)-methyltransferase
MVDWLREKSEQLGIDLTKEMLQQFLEYQRLLSEWNQRVNLTSITDPEAVMELHFLDSLSVQLAVDLNERDSLVDVGTGAGFPGLVLAIAFPSLEVTLVESIEKKAGFLRTVTDELGLAGRVQTVCLRAEAAGQKKGLRESFAVAVARGVARLNVTAEYCLPLVVPGGCFVAMKGPVVQEELEEAQGAFRKLGAREAEVRHWATPSGAGRSLVRIEKVDSTPSGYPRRIGFPAKRPLF